MLLSSSVLRPQTYTAGGGYISDFGIAVSFPIVVSGIYPQHVDTIFGLETVCINIIHPYTAELRIRLVAPDGSYITLSEGLGGSGDNYYGTCFNDFAATSIFKGNPPFAGLFRPVERIGYLNNGQAGQGFWKLNILDTSPWGNHGMLASWTITFGYNPGKPYKFSSSNLPLVFVNTYGQDIPDDPKIPAGFKIIDNGQGNTNHPTNQPAYEGHIGIEIRGSSSQMFPKKSYGFETWDAAGNDINTSLLGMPAESDWILNANFSDKTMLRNALAYQLWQDMGYYATRYRYVELFMNNRYKGVYILSEKIKRDKNRVNIAKITTSDNLGDKLTGGYIFKIDKQTGSGGEGWNSNFPPLVNPNGQFIYYQYEYPKSTDITTAQKDYLKAYVDSFEVALKSPGFADPQAGWRKYAIEQTFFDYFIANEFSKNVDGYRLSTFVHKERNSLGGKLRMGPVWDYDLAWHNANYCSGDAFTGWAYQFPCTGDYWQVPFWWQKLLQDPVFVSNLKCRWSFLRTNILSNTSINVYIDSITTQLNGPQQRNFEIWPILGVYVWPNPSPYPLTYAAEIASLKAWIANRLSWLDANMPGTCQTVGSGQNMAALERRINIYPNPTTGFFSVELLPDIHSPIEIFLYNTQGVMLMHIEEDSGKSKFSLDIGHLHAGVYHLILKTALRMESTRILKATGI
ncbi:MAG: CotH kinase family protein [Bacteroidales bacterium]|nr:CotH kinase family protein [Bacteroidales bacterium]